MVEENVVKKSDKMHCLTSPHHGLNGKKLDNILAAQQTG